MRQKPGPKPMAEMSRKTWNVLTDQADFIFFMAYKYEISESEVVRQILQKAMIDAGHAVEPL